MRGSVIKYHPPPSPFCNGHVEITPLNKMSMDTPLSPNESDTAPEGYNPLEILKEVEVDTSDVSEDENSEEEEQILEGFILILWIF